MIGGGGAPQVDTDEPTELSSSSPSFNNHTAGHLQFHATPQPFNADLARDALADNTPLTTTEGDFPLDDSKSHAYRFNRIARQKNLSVFIPPQRTEYNAHTRKPRDTIPPANASEHGSAPRGVPGSNEDRKMRSHLQSGQSGYQELFPNMFMGDQQFPISAFIRGLDKDSLTQAQFPEPQSGQLGQQELLASLFIGDQPLSAFVPADKEALLLYDAYSQHALSESRTSDPQSSESSWNWTNWRPYHTGQSSASGNYKVGMGLFSTNDPTVTGTPAIAENEGLSAAIGATEPSGFHHSRSILKLKETHIPNDSHGTPQMRPRSMVSARSQRMAPVVQPKIAETPRNPELPRLFAQTPWNMPESLPDRNDDQQDIWGRFSEFPEWPKVPRGSAFQTETKSKIELKRLPAPSLETQTRQAMEVVQSNPIPQVSRKRGRPPIKPRRGRPPVKVRSTRDNPIKPQDDVQAVENKTNRVQRAAQREARHEARQEKREKARVSEVEANTEYEENMDLEWRDVQRMTVDPELHELLRSLEVHGTFDEQQLFDAQLIFDEPEIFDAQESSEPHEMLGSQDHSAMQKRHSGTEEDEEGSGSEGADTVDVDLDPALYEYFCVGLDDDKLVGLMRGGIGNRDIRSAAYTLKKWRVSSANEAKVPVMMFYKRSLFMERPIIDLSQLYPGQLLLEKHDMEVFEQAIQSKIRSSDEQEEMPETSKEEYVFVADDAKSDAELLGETESSDNNGESNGDESNDESNDECDKPNNEHIKVLDPEEVANHRELPHRNVEGESNETGEKLASDKDDDTEYDCAISKETPENETEEGFARNGLTGARRLDRSVATVTAEEPTLAPLGVSATQLSAEAAFNDEMVVTLVELNMAHPLWYHIFHAKRTKPKRREVPEIYCIPQIADSVETKPEFFLVDAISESMSVGNENAALLSGKLLRALEVLPIKPQAADNVLFLILARFSVSCYDEKSLLRGIAVLLLEKLQTILELRETTFEYPFSRHSFSDSRSYDFVMLAALRAHLIPIQSTSTERPPHHKMLMTALWQLLQASEKNAEKHGHTTVTKIRKSITTHSMAVDIFTDLSKLLLPINMYLAEWARQRWVNILDACIKKTGFTLHNVKLAVALYRFNRPIALKIPSTYDLGVESLRFVMSALNEFINEDYFGSTPKHRFQIENVLECMKLVGYMLERVDMKRMIGGITGTPTTGEALFDVACQESCINAMVRYVLIGPLLSTSAEYGHIYDLVWWILHKTPYSFPYMMETLIDLAMDADVNIHMSGQAAMHIATCFISTQQPPLLVAQRVSILETLAMFSFACRTEEAKMHVTQLIQRLATARPAIEPETDFYDPSELGMSESDSEIDNRPLKTR